MSASQGSEVRARPAKLASTRDLECLMHHVTVIRHWPVCSGGMTVQKQICTWAIAVHDNTGTRAGDRAVRTVSLPPGVVMLLFFTTGRCHAPVLDESVPEGKPVTKIFLTLDVLLESEAYNRKHSQRW